MVHSGGSIFHLLVWDDNDGGMRWESSSALSVDNDQEYTCNTRKVVFFKLIKVYFYLVNI